MISIKTAEKLQSVGLIWKPKLHDFFGIPDSNLDHRYFVIADMTIAVEVLKGYPALMFNGAVEWSLDYILQMEVAWIPTEEQLRQQLINRLAGGEEPILQLVSKLIGYDCIIRHNGQTQTFTADTAPEAYAGALLSILQHNS